MKNERMLRDGAEQLGLKLDPKQIERFRVYFDELQAWNRKINLVSAATIDKIVPVHFLDSISCIKSGRVSHGSKIADVGAGGGFPGIPLKVVCPSISITLVEASRKRAQFLEALLRQLDLAEAQVVCTRAEEFAKISSNRESYDIVVARAVAALSVLLEYGLPLLKLGGALVAQKGKVDAQELETAGRAAAVLGGEITQPMRVSVPYLGGERHLIIVQKESETPATYPRRPGIPTKRPLGRA